MSNLPKAMYRQLQALFPEMGNVELFSKVDLAHRGLPEITIVVFDSSAKKTRLVLSRYHTENGRVFANPCFEIALNHRRKIANVVTYMDDRYFHTAAQREEPGSVSPARANRFLFNLLSELVSRKAQQGILI